MSDLDAFLDTLVAPRTGRIRFAMTFRVRDTPDLTAEQLDRLFRRIEGSVENRIEEGLEDPPISMTPEKILKERRTTVDAAFDHDAGRYAVAMEQDGSAGVTYNDEARVFVPAGVAFTRSFSFGTEAAFGGAFESVDERWSPRPLAYWATTTDLGRTGAAPLEVIRSAEVVSMDSDGAVTALEFVLPTGDRDRLLSIVDPLLGAVDIFSLVYGVPGDLRVRATFAGGRLTEFTASTSVRPSEDYQEFEDGTVEFSVRYYGLDEPVVVRVPDAAACYPPIPADLATISAVELVMVHEDLTVRLVDGRVGHFDRIVADGEEFADLRPLDPADRLLPGDRIELVLAGSVPSIDPIGPADLWVVETRRDGRALPVFLAEPAVEEPGETCAAIVESFGPLTKSTWRVRLEVPDKPVEVLGSDDPALVADLGLGDVIRIVRSWSHGKEERLAVIRVSDGLRLR